MKIRTLILLMLTHLSAGAVGFAAGLYALPILIAPSAPSATTVEAMSAQAEFTAEFTKNLKGSDAFHWGEGKVSIGNSHITLMGKLSPGPDYKLYLSPEFVETEVEFESLKPSMALIGDVKTFENFVVAVAPDVHPGEFNTVVVWCETFGEFITAAQYR